LQLNGDYKQGLITFDFIVSFFRWYLYWYAWWWPDQGPKCLAYM